MQKLTPRLDLWTIIGVRDVALSVAWYQSLLGVPATQPAHAHFGQIVRDDGTVLLCLHAWGAHEHPTLTTPEQATPGNGLLLFFRVDDFDGCLARTRDAGWPLAEGPHRNPNTQTMEFSLRDPDGYYVSISALA
jgi:catechol 2,3-dioxygenase-like lactoylglutathione lyase family enzyme